MKSSIVFFIFVFLLLQSVGCRKETVEPVTSAIETIEPVIDTIEIVEPVEDTTNVVEWPPSNGEVIIENLKWIFPWYNTLEIRNFMGMIPSDTLFKVFVKRDNNLVWKEVPLISNNSDITTKYEYFVETRLPDGAGMYNFASLYIFYYGNDVSDSPSVKIIY